VGWSVVNGGLLSLAADVLADQIGEAAFEVLAKLIVVSGFLADHEASAMVAGIKPFCCGSGSAAGAVEAYAGAHFHKWPTLRKFRWFLVLHAHQRQPLVVLKDTNRTDGDFVAALCETDGVPISSGPGHETHDEHRREHNGRENN
jgi:hypothetical protein